MHRPMSSVSLSHFIRLTVHIIFFSSRRRHTSCYRDWSSDVCSSDLSGSLVQNTITLIAMAAVLLPYGPWLPLALLVSTLPAFYVVVRTSRRYHDWWKRRTTEIGRASCRKEDKPGRRQKQYKRRQMKN